MKSVAYTFLLLLIPIATFSQHHHPSAETKPATLMAGLGNHHHPVSTTNTEAQKFFDQGMALGFAFNHDEAARSFQRAAELDPQLAMAYWGIAWAVGPNYNLDVDMEREKAAYDAIQKALSLAAQATDNERAYIEALAKRYSNDPNPDFKKLAVDYKNAMKEVMQRFPDDLDAATIYAESLMNLRPWKLWTSDGKPAEDTEEIVAVLESVLRRDPNHIGANHYYIHAVEASPTPERALASAERLKTLAPAAGHLVHMPAHIFQRTGDYVAAARSNEVAAEADRVYIKNTGVQGIYPMMYYSHNMHFQAHSASMAGRLAEAKQAAEQLEAHVAPHVKSMPMVEAFMPTMLCVLTRFHQWDDILKVPEPDPGLTLQKTMWHYARTLALAGTGKIDKAEAEQKLFMAAVKMIPSDLPFGTNNTAGGVLKVAEFVLDGKLALAKGDKKSAMEFLKKAVEAEDALGYDEPPAWFYPVRESLGGALMLNGEYAEAEKVFRADLEKNPRNGRSLFGLMESLKAQGKTYAAQLVQREFGAAWKNADTQLRVEDL
jgi:tetratricopeptide (TPR) repeat protein